MFGALCAVRINKGSYVAFCDQNVSLLVQLAQQVAQSEFFLETPLCLIFGGAAQLCVPSVTQPEVVKNNSSQRCSI